MKKFRFLLLAPVFIAFVLVGCQSKQNEAPKEANSDLTQAEPVKVDQKGLLKHTVIFKFKDTAPKASVDSCVAAFKALEGKIKEIQAFEFGLNNSPENWHQGFTHCFVLTFKNYNDLAIYAEHPEHKAFGSIVGPHMEKVFVVDYVVE
jgi:hypothetical protein